jgi:hypothetical protein
VHRRDAAESAGRAAWPIRRHALGHEPAGDLSATTTAAERIAMMWPLALEAWAVAGLPLPDYSRASSPSRLLRDGLRDGRQG